MTKQSAPERSTAYCFTINNPEEDDRRLVIELGEREDVVQMVAEDEVGSEGTPHIQGYIKFNKRVYRNTLNIWLHRKAHIEKARATPAQNFKYCTKENQVFYSKGFEVDEKYQKQDREEKANKKAQVILADIAQLSEKDFVLTHTHWYLTHRKDYLTFKTEFDNEKLPDYNGELKDKNYWIFGSAGSGKSVLPSKWTKPELICRKTSNKWYDGYQNYHEIVVIDDIAPGINDQTARNIKNLADRYKFIVEIKNGTRVISPANYCLVITTNYTLEQIFTNEEDLEPIRRRFTFINADEAKRLKAEIQPPPYLAQIQARKKEVPGQSLIDALKELGKEVNKQKAPEEEESEFLNDVISQHQKTKDEIARREANKDERQKKRLSRSQKIQKYKEQGFNTQEAIDFIDAEPETDTEEDPHPVFQGEESESDTEDWRVPNAQKYRPSEVEISQFSDVQESESSETDGVEYDCQGNHSQTVRSSDPLLDILNETETESTDIDLSTETE